MIVPMKKVSLIILGDKKTETLKKLRKLGILHIEITEGSSEKLNELKANISLLENALFSIGKNNSSEVKVATLNESVSISKEIETLSEEKKACQTELIRRLLKIWLKRISIFYYLKCLKLSIII